MYISLLLLKVRGDTFISEVSLLASRALIKLFLKLVLSFSHIICITGSMKACLVTKYTNDAQLELP